MVADHACISKLIRFYDPADAGDRARLAAVCRALSSTVAAGARLRCPCSGWCHVLLACMEAIVYCAMLTLLLLLPLQTTLNNPSLTRALPALQAHAPCSAAPQPQQPGRLQHRRQCPASSSWLCSGSTGLPPSACPPCQSTAPPALLEISAARLQDWEPCSTAPQQQHCSPSSLVRLIPSPGAAALLPAAAHNSSSSSRLPRQQQQGQGQCCGTCTATGCTATCALCWQQCLLAACRARQLQRCW